MKIISKKEWEKMDDLVVNLQLDLIDMRQQKELAEAQVEYLRNEIAKLKGEKKNAKRNKN